MNKSKILKGTLAGTLALTIVGSAVYSSNALVYDSELEEKKLLNLKVGEHYQMKHNFSITMMN